MTDKDQGCCSEGVKEDKEELEESESSEGCCS